MAKRKGRRRDRQPQAPEPPASPRRLTSVASLWRDVAIAVIVSLAAAATVVIWLNVPAQRAGFALTGLVWGMALLGALGRVHGRKAAADLEAMLLHDEIVRARLAPDITEEQSGLKMRHISARLVAGLGMAASAVLWSTHVIERGVGGLSPLVVGMAVSVMLALAVAANAVNRLKARRLARDFRAALNSERLALDTLRSLDVMISAALPSGERMRFNQPLLQFVGKTAAQMQGQGWLEVVHADDRQKVVDLLAKPLANGEGPRSHEMCVRHRNGDFMWLHETLTPRRAEKGKLLEFIGTAVNITKHVENEAALDKQIGDLKADLRKAETELEETKAELSKTKASRTRFENNLEEARGEVTSLQCALKKAEADLTKTEASAAAKNRDIEVDAKERIAKLEDANKAARLEAQQAASESKKAVRAFERLQDELAELRQRDADSRGQIVRHIKETREAKTAAVDANAREAQHRAKADRLTQRCAELETQLAARDKVVTAAKDEAQQAGMAAAAEVERRLHEVSAEALASHLRKQLDMLQRTTSEVLAAALDGPARDAAYNSAAGVRAMSDLVDRAMTSSTSRVSGAAKPPVPAHSAAASFDLRRTVQGVRDLLVDDAKARGIAIDVEFAPNLPALVHGDDIEIRTAIMSLADAAVHAVADGTLVLRLSEEVSTAAHATIRCEVRHASARLKADALEAALAIKATDAAMPDAARQPLAYQAARAWRIIRGLQGQHGYLLPDEGGFSVWFTFTLGRPGTATSASLRAALAAIDESLMPLKQSAPAKAAAVSTASAEVRAAAPTSTPTAPLAVAAALGAHADATPARQMPRMPQELLTCNLGDVAELGADSMRVFCAKSPKGPDVTITFDDVEAGWKIRAEVTWSKKMAVRKHDVGLRFIGLTPEEQKRIQRIAMQHRKVVTMLDGDESR